MSGRACLGWEQGAPRLARETFPLGEAAFQDGGELAGGRELQRPPLLVPSMRMVMAAMLTCIDASAITSVRRMPVLRPKWKVSRATGLRTVVSKPRCQRGSTSDGGWMRWRCATARRDCAGPRSWGPVAVGDHGAELHLCHPKRSEAIKLASAGRSPFLHSV